MATMVNRQWYYIDSNAVHRVTVTAQNLVNATATIILPSGRREIVSAYELHANGPALQERLAEINEERRERCSHCDGSGYIEDYDERWRCRACDEIEL